MPTQLRYATYPSLRDRVVIVSGGASGIGASIVQAFALQDAKVVILDILADMASDLIKELETAGTAHSPIYFQCDVTDIEGALKPVARSILARFSEVDILINNAAYDKRQSTMEITQADWDQSISVNLRHQFFLTQALMAGLLAAESPSVINMGSITWDIPATGLVPYTTCKAAVKGLTKTLAHELGPQGVRVNSIMPGVIATERQKREILTPEYEEWVMSNQALKRLLQPEEVARLALWLAADDRSGVTNQSFVIDAGWV